MVHQGILLAESFKAARILVPVLLVDRNIVRALDRVLQGSFHLLNCCLQLLPLHLHLQDWESFKFYFYSFWPENCDSCAPAPVPRWDFCKTRWDLIRFLINSETKLNWLDPKTEHKEKQGNSGLRRLAEMAQAHLNLQTLVHKLNL